MAQGAVERRFAEDQVRAVRQADQFRGGQHPIAIGTS
jgi:hypothetical protein